jgi:hypothetical protein
MMLAQVVAVDSDKTILHSMDTMPPPATPRLRRRNSELATSSQVASVH